ncbi:MAG: hypothetical protein KAU21_09605 [Gammaproteobacteria bacterium]|nr:hypothetical protein [Gammaproteobacteria bacterium]
MIKFKAALLVLIWSFTTNGYADEQQGFDEVCRIYTEAKNSNMNVETASKYIFDNIKKRVNSKEVLQTHTAVMEAMGDDRYPLFKGSAEHVLKSNQ